MKKWLILIVLLFYSTNPHTNSWWNFFQSTQSENIIYETADEQITLEVYTEQNYNQIDSTQWKQNDSNHTYLKKMIQKHSNLYQDPFKFVAIEAIATSKNNGDHQVIGTAFFTETPDKADYWWMEDVDIDDEYQRKGIATAMIKQFEVIVKPKLIACYAIWGGGSCYKKLGFNYINLQDLERARQPIKTNDLTTAKPLVETIITLLEDKKLAKKAVLNQLQAKQDKMIKKLVDAIVNFIKKQENENYSIAELTQLFITQELSIEGTMIKVVPENF